MSTCHRLCMTCLLLVFCSLSATRGAHACSATTQDVFSVGNKTADGSCNFASIQAAIDAATCATGTKIILNASGDYTNQHLSITNKNITLVGRANAPQCSTPQPACGVPPLYLACPTAPLRTIEGNIRIRGSSNVTLQYLEVTNGHGTADSNGTTYGGAIDYAATGRLDIDASTIDHNTANNGGGIRFQGYGGNADLYLHQHTQVDHNTATNGGSGGGIRVEGQATLHADEPNTWIHDNVAADKGGGIIVIGPANAHIGSGGDVFFGTPVGVVSVGNTANYGGGIALFANSNGSVNVNLLATDPAHPVRIEQNRAYHTGGGVYLVPYIYVQGGGAVPINFAELDMQGAHVDGNAAQEGAGIYADTNSTFAFGTTVYAGGEVYAAANGGCATGVECNTVSNNRAVATDGQGNETPTAGSAILIQTQGIFKVDRLAMRGNQAAHAIRVADSLHDTLQLNSCLLANNTLYAELIAFGDASASINQCTIAGNVNIADGYALLLANADLTLTNSIFAEGSQQTLDNTNGGATLILDYVMSGETASLSSGTHIIQSNDPGFVDPGSGDFHLRASSPAIDVAPAVAGDDRDLENRPRDQDLPETPNLDGPRDLGAYERQPSSCEMGDTIFSGGQVEIGVIADAVDTVGILRGDSITATTLAPVREIDCCGVTAAAVVK